jgi:formylglycine-generating enzyme
MGNRKVINKFLALASVVVMASCGGETSSNLVSEKTGMNYNDPRLGGYDVAQVGEQVTAPGVQFVEGGTFTMGATDEDVTYENNNAPHRVTVSSFYMDETEVANVHYREYVYWMSRTFGSDYPNLVMAALPDTACWRKALQYNEPMVENYFRHGSYSYYPVVGVTWRQANDYCKWRTDRVNEILLIKAGYLKKNPNQVSEDNFNYQSYLAGQYEGAVGNKKRDLDPTGGGKRNVRLEDGITLPAFRLPTEAEWEYAALALVGQNPVRDTKRRRGEEIVTDRQVYPWGDNHSTREGINNQYQGEQLANYRRGAGDMMGVAGGLNDNADRPTDVYSYKANAFGLYNMAGNVSEWVMDVYRADAPDGDGFNPFRGNVYTRVKNIPEDGTIEEKDSLGNLVRVEMTQEELAENNIDYRTADNRDYGDGDTNRIISMQYQYDRDAANGSTLINNNSRVIKGASWNDRAYWLSPGTRRYYQELHTSSTIGFRCCVDRLGSPSLGTKGGNNFGRHKNTPR